MRKSHPLFFLIALMFLSCNNASNKNNTNVDSVVIDSHRSDANESAINQTLIGLNKEILTAIKKHDYQSLVKHIHPTAGLHLSPYATISLNNDVVIMASEFLEAIKSDVYLFWGNYDGTGDPIDLTTKDYFKEFVYDVDFVNAEKVTVNKSSSQGNSINNILSVYPESNYVENYFSGFVKEYDGMDWRALRLVFKEENGKHYLMAIVHDQWTI